METQSDPQPIRWRLHLNSPVHVVYQALSTAAGRAQFWAESAEETEGAIHFIFPNNITWEARVLKAVPPSEYVVQYYGNSVVAFELRGDDEGGTDLTMTDSGVATGERSEVSAGWVSVLMSLKAAVDFGVDLRNHDPHRHWDQGYVDN